MEWSRNGQLDGDRLVVLADGARYGTAQEMTWGHTPVGQVRAGKSYKTTRLIYQPAYVRTITDGHELCLVTARTRSRIQEAEKRLLCRASGLSLRSRLRSPDIQRVLSVEPLLLGVETYTYPSWHVGISQLQAACASFSITGC